VERVGGPGREDTNARVENGLGGGVTWEESELPRHWTETKGRGKGRFKSQSEGPTVIIFTKIKQAGKAQGDKVWFVLGQYREKGEKVGRLDGHYDSRGHAPSPGAGRKIGEKRGVISRLICEGKESGKWGRCAFAHRVVGKDGVS